jgi:hypothetical protein
MTNPSEAMLHDIATCFVCLGATLIPDNGGLDIFYKEIVTVSYAEVME